MKTSKKKPLDFRLTTLLPWIAMVVTTVVYVGSFSNGFVDIGDQQILTNTSITKSSFFEALGKIFSAPTSGDFHPLTTFSYWVDYNLFGANNPRGWHGINLLLHLVSVLLVFKATSRLGFSTLVAFSVALIFGVHPMHVESVAWIAQRKDLLAGVFYLGALLTYIKGRENTSPKYQWYTIILFVLAILSQAISITIPFAMLAVDYLLDKGWTKHHWISKWKFFVLSLIGLVGAWLVTGSYGFEYGTHGLIDQVILGASSIGVQILKLIAPFGLSVLHETPSAVSGLYYISLMIPVLLIGLLWFLDKKKYSVAFFGLFFFVSIVAFYSILPLEQFKYMAEHHTYISYLGLLIPLCYYIFNWAERRNQTVIGKAIMGILIIVFSFLSVKQISTWENGQSLWSQTINAHPNSSEAYQARGNYFLEKEDLNLALGDFDRALALEESADLFGQRANAYLALSGDESDDKAIGDLNKAIALNPNNGSFYRTRALVYKKKGFVNRVLKDLNSAVKYQPNEPENYFERARNYGFMGEYPTAMKDINMAVTLRPWNCGYLKLRMEFHKSMGNNENFVEDEITLRKIGC